MMVAVAVAARAKEELKRVELQVAEQDMTVRFYKSLRKTAPGLRYDVVRVEMLTPPLTLTRAYEDFRLSLITEGCTSEETTRRYAFHTCGTGDIGLIAKNGLRPAHCTSCMIYSCGGYHPKTTVFEMLDAPGMYWISAETQASEQLSIHDVPGYDGHTLLHGTQVEVKKIIPMESENRIRAELQVLVPCSLLPSGTLLQLPSPPSSVHF
jgi:hypothetical protein